MGRQIMKLLSLLFVSLLVPCAFAADTVQRIYTAPDPAATGGIKGTVNAVITHALAVNHDHVEVYRGEVSNGGRTFQFAHLPVGKYDLVLVTADAKVYEGLALGEEKRDLPPGSLEHLKQRVMAQDAFFNRAQIQRIGFDGENAYVFMERIRDKNILTQGGVKVDATLRRFEIIELAQAADDWQVTVNRHLYREEQPPGGINFLLHGFVPALGNLRVVDGVKDLGSLMLSSLQ